MGAAIQAGAAGEQAVAIADVYHIFFGAAGRHDCTGAAFVPQVNIVLRIESDYPAAGCAAGGLDTHAIL